MKLICPSCHAPHSAEAWTSDADARMALLLAAELPGELGGLAIRYLGLFRPAKRGLAWARVRKLLEELAGMIRAGSIRRNGRDWPAPVAAWRIAMQKILDKRDDLDLPLDGHGYLLTILAGDANKQEAQAERATEETRRNRPAPAGDAEAAQVLQNQMVSTALLLLHSESVARKARMIPFERADASELLLARGFKGDVIERALDRHFGRLQGAA